jgi:thiamine biosynthesis lipoprotein
VIDPRTLRPARGLISATVVAADLGVADALATAAVAYGSIGAPWLAARPGVAAMGITDEGVVVMTPAFEAYRSQ